MMLKFALRFAVTLVLMVTGATISTAGDHTARSNQSALLPAVHCCDICPPICPLRHNGK